MKEEITAVYTGIRDYIADVTWDDFLPPPVIKVKNWMIELFPRLLGMRGPGRQVTAGAALTLASIILLPFLWPLVPVFAVAMLIGLLRFSPTFEKYWPLNRDEYQVM